jgi:hypothetical protein
LYLGRAGSRSRKPLNFHKKVSKQHRQQKGGAHRYVAIRATAWRLVPLWALLGVVKDNPKSVAHTAANAAHTMPKVDAIFAPRSFDWTVVDGECYRVTLS